jgi:hypothetical protein
VAGRWERRAHRIRMCRCRFRRCRNGCETVEQRGRLFWIAERARPFAEGEIGGDQKRGAPVEPADERRNTAARLRS